MMTLLLRARIKTIIIFVPLFFFFFVLHVDALHDDKSKHHHNDDDCICGPLLPRPDVIDHLAMARWMVHSLHMGVLSTTSTKEGTPTVGSAFGNVYSYVDGPCHKSIQGGIPYFYTSPLDQSAKDARVHPRVSLTLTEAFLPTACHRYAEPSVCAATAHGDPEMPTCARLVLSGNWVEVHPQKQEQKDNDDDDDDDDEYAMAKDALFQRHPVMAYWPQDHDWMIMRLDIDDLWFLDYFGGAYQLNVQDYLQMQWPPEDQVY